MIEPRVTPGVYRAPGGVVLHLFLPGYVQGSKARHPAAQGLCAVAAWRVVWLEAVPSVAMLKEYRWCGKCIGLALVHFGLHGAAVEAVVPRFGVETPTPTQGRREGIGSPDGVADPNELSGGRQQPKELVPVAPATEERGGVGSAPAPPAQTAHKEMT